MAEEETLPDPEEQLMLHQGNGRVWLVKVSLWVLEDISDWIRYCLQVPKHLMERWSAIDAEDVHLASIRVYSEAKNAAGKTPRIMLFLPPHPSDITAVNDSTRPVFSPNAAYNTNPNDTQPDVYELDMVNDNVENQIVIAERPKIPDPNSTEPLNPRARTTVHTGRVRHNCNLRPVMNAAYMRQMRERTRKYNTPQRQIGRIEDAGISGGRGGINMLSSGVGVGSGTAFNSLVVSFCFVRILLSSEPPSCVERKTKAQKRRLRAHGPYAQEPTSRSALLSFPREALLADQSTAREDATARKLSQRNAAGDCDTPSKWGAYRHVGAECEFQRRWSGWPLLDIYICH